MKKRVGKPDLDRCYYCGEKLDPDRSHRRMYCNDICMKRSSYQKRKTNIDINMYSGYSHQIRICQRRIRKINLYVDRCQKRITAYKNKIKMYRKLRDGILTSVSPTEIQEKSK